jgi:hypothetical protein
MKQVIDKHKINPLVSFPTLFPYVTGNSSSASPPPLLQIKKKKKMEVSSVVVIFSSTLLLAILTLGWRILNWVWLRPKYLERRLREQGFSGNSYRLFFGDLKDGSIMSKQAKSKPINFSDDISPRVAPFMHHTFKNYGMSFANLNLDV